jgi:hypothetical protein
MGISRNQILVAAFWAAIAVLWVSVLFYLLASPMEKSYNCELSEISPDFPKQIKMQCREMRLKK